MEIKPALVHSCLLALPKFQRNQSCTDSWTEFPTCLRKLHGTYMYFEVIFDLGIRFSLSRWCFGVDFQKWNLFCVPLCETRKQRRVWIEEEDDCRSAPTDGKREYRFSEISSEVHNRIFNRFRLLEMRFILCLGISFIFILYALRSSQILSVRYLSKFERGRPPEITLFFETFHILRPTYRRIFWWSCAIFYLHTCWVPEWWLDEGSDGESSGRLWSHQVGLHATSRNP